jgi:hypothetical protein
MPSFILRDLDPDFWSRVQAKAAREGVTVKSLILRLLTQWLGAAIVALVAISCVARAAHAPGSAAPARARDAFTSRSPRRPASARGSHAAVSVRVVDALKVPVPDVRVTLGVGRQPGPDGARDRR